MTKHEYLQELAHYLRRMPETERNDALMFFDEYISDAGGTFEAQAAAIEELGKPAHVAAQVIAYWATPEANSELGADAEQSENGGNAADSQASYEQTSDGHASDAQYTQAHRRRGKRAQGKSGLKVLGIVLLALFASPIALPIAGVIFIAAMSVLGALLTAVVTIAVAGVGLIIGGVASIGVGIVVLFSSFGTGIAMIGGGLMCVGAATGLIFVTRLIGKYGVGGLIRWISGKIKNRTRKAATAA